jgi:hypothetical protein
VATSGTAHTVQLPGADGTATSVDVQVGAIGAQFTEITSGVSAGQQVILADLSKPLATSNSNSSNSGLAGLSGSNSGTQITIQRPGGGAFTFQGGGQGGTGSQGGGTRTRTGG